MPRSVVFTLLALALLLALFPLAVNKPGMPLTLKADEPAYYLAALSLARDGDLACEVRDTRRLLEEFPYSSARNLILMTDDGWRTVYFGKPYIYSLFATPFAALAGAGGMVSFNMLLLVGMIWLGARYLSRWNPPWLAALFSASFFVLSNGFVYVFWLHPEIFNMAAITAAYYLVFHRPEPKPELPGRFRSLLRRLERPGVRAALSGAALALAAYNKPMLALLGLPCFLLAWHRDGLHRAALWVVGAAISGVLVCAISIGFTGHPSAYLGVTRQGVSIHDPDHLPMRKLPLASPEIAKETNSWDWMFRLPKVEPGVLLGDLGYFLVGRHTGLFPYAPFTLLALLLFVTTRRRDWVRWSIVGSLLAVALTFLIWIPFNWHGGGGFVGNRYFVNALPAFLFLVSRIVPAWLPVAGVAVGALFVGPLVFTPFGAPVTYPTLQSHVRNWPFQLLPLELSLEGRIPGYRGSVQGELYFWGRTDVFKPKGNAMLVYGARRVEIWVKSVEPLERLLFRVVNLAPDNEIRIRVPGDEETLHFPDPLPSAKVGRQVELHPTHPTTVRTPRRKAIHYYRMTVETSTGRYPEPHPGEEPDYFLAGAILHYLGSRELLGRQVYAVEWIEAHVPERVAAGAGFEVPVRLRNASEATWPARGAVRVRIGWRWVDGSGVEARATPARAELPRDLEPGAAAELAVPVNAPERPGRYVLELNPVFEKVAWFRDREPESVLRRPVRVVPANREPVSAP